MGRLENAILIGFIILYGVLFSLLLAGCVNPPAPINTPCGTLRTYSKEQQAQIAVAERKLSDDSPLHLVVTDWIQMRDEARACAQ